MGQDIKLVVAKADTQVARLHVHIGGARQQEQKQVIVNCLDHLHQAKLQAAHSLLFANKQRLSHIRVQ